MWPRVRNHVCSLIGLSVMAVFLVHEAFGGLPNLAEQALRVLIVPMYVVWLAFTVAQVAIAGPEPTAMSSYFRVASLIIGLAPYALFDRLIHRWRTRSGSTERT